MNYRDLPLRKKLIFIGLASVGFAMLLSGGLLFVTEFFTTRDDLLQDLEITVEILGYQCEAALLFNVRDDAQKTLQALRASPSISYAAVYNRAGGVFAQYSRPGIPLPRKAPPDKEGHRFVDNHVVVTRAITVNDKIIGTVAVWSELEKYRTLLRKYLVSTGGIFTASLLLSYLLVLRLQTSITRPVSDLVKTMQDVSLRKDFSVRIGDDRGDEMGVLARGLNTMLLTIQERDQELESHREDLERTIAELKYSAMELEAANRKLRDLDMLKSEFISVASHELRTPLTAIKAFVELLRVKPAMNAEKKNRIIRIIEAETDRLTRLISDLLDLSRIEMGNAGMRFDPVSIQEVLNSALDAITPLAKNKGLNVAATLDPDLPPAEGDRDRLIQVATNLLSNAVKFTPPRGRIDVAARYEQNPHPRIMISITDSGIGIPEQDLMIIFDKFQRSGDHTTRTVEGTGLGLAIAREIVQHHGGMIWAESVQGKGSIFRFTLPISKGYGQ